MCAYRMTTGEAAIHDREHSYRIVNSMKITGRMSHAVSSLGEYINSNFINTRCMLDFEMAVTDLLTVLLFFYKSNELEEVPVKIVFYAYRVDRELVPRITLNLYGANKRVRHSINLQQFNYIFDKDYSERLLICLMIIEKIKQGSLSFKYVCTKTEKLDAGSTYGYEDIFIELTFKKI